MASDLSNDQAAPSNPVPGMVQLVVNAQYVKDLSFENPRAPQSLIDQKQPEVALNVDVSANRLAPDVYEVSLTLGANAKAGGEAIFMVELIYAAVVTITGASEDQLAQMILVDTPYMLFPYARSIVSNATRDGGFPPLMINPIDFGELLRRQKAEGQKPGNGTAFA